MKMRRIKQTIISIALAFFIALTILPALPVAKDSTFANAGIWCSKIGTNMSGRHAVNVNSVTAPSVSARKWTVQELFNNSIAFTTYNGEGKGDFWFADTNWRTEKVANWDGDVKSKSEAKRNFGDCTFGGFTSTVSTGLINFAGGVVNIAQFFIVRLYSGDVICTDPNAPQGGCINIIGIVGGSNSKNGIIGSLRDSIFSPLATLMFIVVACWVLYKGIFKREFRTSLMGLLWSVGIFIFGLIALNKPAMLASAPQTVNSALSTCLVGAMNGQSCVSGTVTAPSTIVGTECESYGTSVGTEGAALATNALTCSIWKSFVLDAWSRGEFGYNYNELYLKDAPTDGSVWKNAPEDVDPFVVNLKSTGSAPKDGETIETSTVPINNLALYQLYISSDMKSLGDNQWANDNGQDLRWYNIIKAASKDNRMWNHWTPNSVYGVKRITSAFVSVIMAVVVSALLAVTSFWGLVYMFAGSILMTFAPFFLLIAIEPGKGRRIFLGWLESVTSSILKYMASALIVLVALALYAAILSSTSNYISSFIGVAIMTGVLMMYRKELVNLLGMTSLGGQRLSNAVGDRLSKKGKRAKDFAKIIGGSAIGGAIAEKQNGGSILQGLGTGAKEGTGRQLRRGNSMVSGIARQYESVNRAYTKANSDEARDEKQISAVDAKMDKATSELKKEFTNKTREFGNMLGLSPEEQGEVTPKTVNDAISAYNGKSEGDSTEGTSPRDEIISAKKNVTVDSGINVKAKDSGSSPQISKNLSSGIARSGAKPTASKDVSNKAAQAASEVAGAAAGGAIDGAMGSARAKLKAAETASSAASSLVSKPGVDGKYDGVKETKGSKHSRNSNPKGGYKGKHDAEKKVKTNSSSQPSTEASSAQTRLESEDPRSESTPRAQDERRNEGQSEPVTPSMGGQIADLEDQEIPTQSRDVVKSKDIKRKAVLPGLDSFNEKAMQQNQDLLDRNFTHSASPKDKAQFNSSNETKFKDESSNPLKGRLDKLKKLGGLGEKGRHDE